MLRIYIIADGISNKPLEILSPKTDNDTVVKWVQLICDFPNKYTLRVELNFSADERVKHNIEAARKVMEISSKEGEENLANDAGVLMGLLCNLGIGSSVEQEAKEDKV